MSCDVALNDWADWVDSFPSDHFDLGTTAHKQQLCVLPVVDHLRNQHCVHWRGHVQKNYVDSLVSVFQYQISASFEGSSRRATSVCDARMPNTHYLPTPRYLLLQLDFVLAKKLFTQIGQDRVAASERVALQPSVYDNAILRFSLNPRLCHAFDKHQRHINVEGRRVGAAASPLYLLLNVPLLVLKRDWSFNSVDEVRCFEFSGI